MTTKNMPWLIARGSLGGWLVLALGACGGGGGSSTPAVTIQSATSPVSVSAFQGDRTPPIVITGHVSGVIQSVAGQAIHARASGGEAFWLAPEEGSTFNSGPEFTLQLDGKPIQASPGPVDGVLAIDVCLDAACNTPLPGSPLRVPFHVDVKRGLVVDMTPIDLTTTFGLSPPSRDLAVTLPEDTVSIAASSDVNGTLADATPVDPATPGVSTIHLDFGPTPVAEASGSIHVIAHVVDSIVGDRLFTADVPLHYTVVADPAVDVWPIQSPLTLQSQAGVGGGRFTSYGLLTVGGWATEDSTVYDAPPPQAAGMALASAWLDYYYGSFTTCDASGCLPPGTYTASVQWQYVKDGVSKEALLPVVLTITP
jgi:hypothetical protein